MLANISLYKEAAMRATLVVLGEELYFCSPSESRRGRVNTDPNEIPVYFFPGQIVPLFSLLTT